MIADKVCGRRAWAERHAHLLVVGLQMEAFLGRGYVRRLLAELGEPPPYAHDADSVV